MFKYFLCFNLIMNKIKEIMTKKVITASPNEKVSMVISRMEKYDIKELPVIKDNKVIGAITLYKLFNENVDPKETIKKYVEKLPIINQKEDVKKALKLLLDSGKCALIVVDNKYFLRGIISEYDILKLYINSFSKFNVSDVVRKVPLISEEEKLSKADYLMRRHKIDRLAVGKDNEIFGLLLKLDLMRKVYALKPLRDNKTAREDFIKDSKNLLVKGIYRKNVPILNYNMPLNEALSYMLKNNIKGLPVKNEIYEGIVLRRDIFNLLREITLADNVSLDVSGNEKNEDIDNIVNSKLSKLKKLISGARFKLNIKTIHNEKKPKYEINLHLSSKNKDIRVKEEGWKLKYTLNRAIKKLRNLVKKKFKK